MGTIEILQDTLAYIDAHLGDALDVETLAVRAGFSVWHFCRLFQWGVGCSVMGYVRSRRLAFAASDLKTGKKILDIALAYGFETHSGFSKAFRRRFGCSPEVYRSHASCDRPLLPNLISLKKCMIGGISLEPKFTTLPAVRLAGYVMKTTNENGENNAAIPAFWVDYLRNGRMKKLHEEPFLKSHAEYGACFPENPETGEFEYMIGVELKGDAVELKGDAVELKKGEEVPKDYQIRELPPATYAVFSTPPCEAPKFSAAIQSLWNCVFNDWFPASGYEYAPDCVDFEYYDERCASGTGSVCDIYIPVVKKKS